MSGNGYRRRIVLVDRKFQIGIAGRIVSYLAGYLVFFFVLAVFAPFVGAALDGATSEETAAALSELVLFANRLAVPLFLTFVCLALHTILLTHRVAGPVYRFQKTFEGWAGGEISQNIHLRSGDFMTKLAETYNQVVGELRDRLDELHLEAEGILKEAGEGNSTARVRAERMLRIIEQYNTGSGSAPPKPAPVPVEQEEEPALNQ